MRIATWNVNSVRARLDRVLAYLTSRDIDILALQETRVKTTLFPSSAFEAAGYEVAAWGLDGYNGVAVVSRVGLANVERGFAGQPGFGQEQVIRADDGGRGRVGGEGQEVGGGQTAGQAVTQGDVREGRKAGLVDGGGLGLADDADTSVIEARALGALCGEVQVWSLYIPHGRALDHSHMTYKLAWLEALRRSAADWMDDGPTALLGDWNVAPFDSDVWDINVFAGQTHISEPERAALAGFAADGWREVSREHLPEPHTYTFWDNRDLCFPRNHGMRIDFAYCSPALADRVSSAAIVREERKGKGASDHVPVEFEVT